MRKFTLGIVVLLFVAALLIGGQYAYHRLFDPQPHYSAKFPADAIANQIIFSPDEKYLVLTGLYQILLIDAKNGQEVNAWKFDEPIETLTFSPDSRQIVFYTQASDQLAVLTWATETIETIPLPAQYVVKDLAFSPDGSLLAVAGTETLLWEFSKQSILHTLPEDAKQVSFSTDGQQFMLVSADNQVAIYPTEHLDQGAVVTQAFSDDSFNHLQLDTTGQKLLLTTEDGRVFTLDAQTVAVLSQHQLRASVDTNLIFTFVPSPRADLMAVLQVSRLWLFDPQNGRVVADDEVDGHMIAVGFNKSGDTMAVYTHRDDTYTLAVWGVKDFLERYRP